MVDFGQDPLIHLGDLLIGVAGRDQADRPSLGRLQGGKALPRINDPLCLLNRLLGTGRLGGEIGDARTRPIEVDVDLLAGDEVEAGPLLARPTAPLDSKGQPIERRRIGVWIELLDNAAKENWTASSASSQSAAFLTAIRSR